jgi:hypothetical protein
LAICSLHAAASLRNALSKIPTNCAHFFLVPLFIFPVTDLIWQMPMNYQYYLSVNCGNTCRASAARISAPPLFSQYRMFRIFIHNA